MTWTIPNTFATQSGSIPLSQLDANFAYVATNGLQLNASTYAIDVGSANAYQAYYTPSITITPSSMVNNGTVLWFMASNTNTGGSTFSVNGGTAYPIYNSSGSALTSSSITANFITGVAWNSTLNSGVGAWQLLFQSTVTVSSLPSLDVRQTVAIGSVTSTGQANLLTTGSGLSPLLSATSNNVRINYADGSNDYVETISTDTSFPSVPANLISFLSVNRVSAGNNSLNSTLSPPQYGYAYNPSAQSSLTLNNVSTDDYSNTWTNTNVTFTNSTPQISGTYYGVFNGSSSKISSTAFTYLYSSTNTGFSMRAWCKTASQAAMQTLFSAINAGNYGIQIQVNTSGKVLTSLSSTGSTWDIANSTAGTVTLSNGTWYFIEVTQDTVAGKYYVYVNGTLDKTVTSTATICPITTINIGYSPASNYWNGNIQGFEFLPYCQNPAGTTYTTPTTLANIANSGYSSDFFSIPQMTMYGISSASTVAGTLPTFAKKKSVYIGEAIAGSTTISSVVSYAYNRRYSSGAFAVVATTAYAKSHNLGIPPELITLSVTAGATSFAGNTFPQTQGYFGGSYGYIPTAGAQTRNSISMTTLTYPINNTTGSVTTGYYTYNVSGVF
jgi:hypothetical protein